MRHTRKKTKPKESCSPIREHMDVLEGRPIRFRHVALGVAELDVRYCREQVHRQ